MALSIVTNVASLNAQRHLVSTQGNLDRSLGRLSSGLRINRAGDDAAGLAISENLKAQIRSLSQAERNANDGVSLLQTAEGAMNEISSMLTRMRELSIQSATDTVGVIERGFIQAEFSALITEVDRIADVTQFNSTNLLDGSLTAIEFQVGIHDTLSDRISVAVDDMHTTMLGTSAGGPALSAQSVTTKTGARAALDVLDQAILDISDGRADIGAVENRLQVTISNLASARQNLSAANSRIRDTDMAEETANMTRQNILMQAGVSVLSQANQIPSLALSLLG
ncbi:MAG: flagellin [Myxococcales bacterium]|nr:flagellin [Myxococcales bacterium]